MSYPQPYPSSPKKGLPWWAILLIIGAVLVALVAAAVGGVVYWVANNAERLAAEGNEVKAAGRAYAEEHDQAGCFDEGFRRRMACSGDIDITCNAKANIFFEECAKNAPRADGFCDDVPGPGASPLTIAGFATARCADRSGRAANVCSNLATELIAVCAGSATEPPSGVGTE